MDYSNIKVVKAYLPKGTAPTDDEAEMRRLAYEAHRNTDEFVAAHCFRLGKNYPDFTPADWAEVLKLEGVQRIRTNMAACAACLQHGLL